MKKHFKKLMTLFKRKFFFKAPKFIFSSFYILNKETNQNKDIKVSEVFFLTLQLTTF